MFRRKQKDTGVQNITLLDDDEPNPSTIAPSRPTFTSSASAYDQLELNKHTEKGPTAEQLDAMDAAQLEQLVQQSAQAGKESTARALQIATEAREIGANTAATMQEQTAQLERMTDQIEVVHDYLDKSERTIEKMTKPKLVRMFQRKRPTGKGLEKHKANRKEEEEREKLRADGLESLDMRVMQSDGENTVTMRDLDTTSTGSAIATDSLDEGEDSNGSSSSNVKNRLKLFAGRRKASNTEASSTAPQSSRAIKEDYSQYSEGTANLLRKQDEDLDKISDALGDMRSMAQAMNNELDYQSRIIDDVQTFTAETSKRTKEHNRRIARFQ